MVVYHDRGNIDVTFKKYRAHVSIYQSTVTVDLIKAPILNKKDMNTLFQLLNKQFKGTKKIKVDGKYSRFSRYLEQRWSDLGLSVELGG